MKRFKKSRASKHWFFPFWRSIHTNTMYNKIKKKYLMHWTQTQKPSKFHWSPCTFKDFEVSILKNLKLAAKQLTSSKFLASLKFHCFYDIPTSFKISKFSMGFVKNFLLHTSDNMKSMNTQWKYEFEFTIFLFLHFFYAFHSHFTHLSLLSSLQTFPRISL